MPGMQRGATRDGWRALVRPEWLPALVVLAAEPLYVLVDTAIVGHIGTQPLAGLVETLAGELVKAGVAQLQGDTLSSAG